MRYKSSRCGRSTIRRRGGEKGTEDWINHQDTENTEFGFGRRTVGGPGVDHYICYSIRIFFSELRVLCVLVVNLIPLYAPLLTLCS